MPFLTQSLNSRPTIYSGYSPERLTYFNIARKISPIKLQDNFDNYEEYIHDVHNRIELARRQFIKAKKKRLKVIFFISINIGDQELFGKDVFVFTETYIYRGAWASIEYCISLVLSLKTYSLVRTVTFNR